MMVDAFAKRTRARLTEMRVALTRLREVSKETSKTLAKLAKQNAVERDKLYEHLNTLAEETTSELPEDVSEVDWERASALQDQVNDLAAAVEEIELADSSLESLPDDIAASYDSLKEAEALLVKAERLGSKLGI